MFDSDLIHSSKELVLWFNSYADTESTERKVLESYISSKLYSLFKLSDSILISFTNTGIKIGNKEINYPFFIENLENMIEEIQDNPKDHISILTNTTQSLFN